MAERKVEKGKIFVLIGIQGQSEKNLYCLIDITRNYTQNLNDAASICEPAGKSLGTQDFSADMNLYRVWDVDAANYSEVFLTNALLDGSIVTLTIGPATPVTDDVVETGVGYITSATKVDNATDLGTMSITVTYTEKPVQTIVT